MGPPEETDARKLPFESPSKLTFGRISDILLVL